MDGAAASCFPKLEVTQKTSKKLRGRRERNKRRRISIREKKKEKVSQVYAKTKILEKELAHTKSLLTQSRIRAAGLSKELYKTPKKHVTALSSLRYSIRSRPTASSLHCDHKLGHHPKVCQVNKLDQYSLKNPGDSSNCEVGSGTFGKCSKMFLCATEVAVKSTTLDEYSYDSILNEAVVMTEVCRGHPNLPLFIGIYDYPEYPKPLLVMKFYSVAGKPYTLHQCLRQESLSLSPQSTLYDWARILLGVCDGLQAIHQRGYLHNDIKCDNVVLSDCVPKSDKAPSMWPIIIDFGKATTIKSPKVYKLDEREIDSYLKTYTHLAPELVKGTSSQSVLTDVYSLCRIIGKVACVFRYKELKSIAKLCTKENRPSLLLGHDSITDLT